MNDIQGDSDSSNVVIELDNESFVFALPFPPKLSPLWTLKRCVQRAAPMIVGDLQLSCYFEEFGNRRVLIEERSCP